MSIPGMKFAVRKPLMVQMRTWEKKSSPCGSRPVCGPDGPDPRLADR